MNYFSTDKFLRQLKTQLDERSNGIKNDLIWDGCIIAQRIVDLDKPANHNDITKQMAEMRTLIDMIEAYEYDCNNLYSEFDRLFCERHGEGKHSASAIDAMDIIANISNRIYDIAPHLDYFFKDPDNDTIQQIYNNSFVMTFEIPKGALSESHSV